MPPSRQHKRYINHLAFDDSNACARIIADGRDKTVHLRGIHTLDISECNQATIADAAFVHLRLIHTLDMSHCTHVATTNAAFAHLVGINTVSTIGCRRNVRVAAA